ncbi:MAG TPA: hypothetical protein VGC47_11495 [Acidimicrobiia bacterium]|jgi:hypothetical protein
MHDLSDRHRKAKLQAALNRLRCQAMEAVYRELRAEEPPATRSDTELEARMALARRWDDLRPEIRTAIAGGGSWAEIASRVVPVGEEIVSRRGLWPLLRVWASAERREHA